MKLLKSSISPYITTKATPSVPAKCTNLKRFLKKSVHENDDRLMALLVESISRKFWEINQQNWSLQHLFKYVSPDKIDGLEKSLNELQSWEHRFGHTPKFVISIQIDKQISVDLKLENGFIVDFVTHSTETSQLNNSDQKRLDEFKDILKIFINCRLDHLDISKILDQIRNSSENVYASQFYEFLNKHLI